MDGMTGQTSGCWNAQDQVWGGGGLRAFVLDRLKQGVCVYDRNRRLLLWNKRYAEMYKLDPRELHAGMTLPEVVALRCRAGTGPDMPAEEYVAWRDRVQVQDGPSDTVVVLRNGDVHEIHHQPTPDGGWVATFDDITERCRSDARLAHMAHHDALTDLPNRVLFHGRLSRVLARLAEGAGREGAARESGAAVLCLDLDRFKAVNDGLGHAAGDALLQAAAARMRAELRGGDTLARLGGDEFAAIVSVRDAADAEACAGRIVRAMAAPFAVGGATVSVGVSVGIALCEAGAEPDVERVMRCADAALYEAKGAGRGVVRVFRRGSDAPAARRRRLEAELRLALERAELSVQYQPQFDLRTGACTGREALVRWRRDGADVEPSEFIPVAEEAGLIGTIGAWVLRTACADAAGWGDGLRLAVNLSPVQVRAPGLVTLVAEALRDAGLAPGRLELEITEGTLMDDTPHTLQVLDGLRALGVGVVLDDFGKGYSSLSYLRRFPFTKLKIDKEFAAVDEAGNAAIVRAVAAMGSALGLRVTAEGIETAGQLAAVRALGCDEGQGYYLGRPG